MPNTAAPQVFVSYRRDDSAGYARAIYDALAARLGHERVFMDVDDIGAGQPFDEVIQHAVGGSRVLLVLIGRRWVGPREGERPRIQSDADLVRREVEAGLAKGMRVIPLLLDGTPMPPSEQLPQSLQALPGLNAMEIGNARFAEDMARLLAVVETTLGPALAKPGPGPTAGTNRRRGWLCAAAGAATVLLAATATMHLSRAPPVPPGPLRAAINGSWLAAVRYGWPNADYTERFELSGSGAELLGSASFLQVPRGVLEGTVDGRRVRFITRTTEVSSSGQAETTHRYHGELVGDELRLTMQTEGGSAAHLPVPIVARRVVGSVGSAASAAR